MSPGCNAAVFGNLTSPPLPWEVFGPEQFHLLAALLAQSFWPFPCRDALGCFADEGAGAATALGAKDFVYPQRGQRWARPPTSLYAAVLCGGRRSCAMPCQGLSLHSQFCPVACSACASAPPSTATMPTWSTSHRCRRRPHTSMPASTASARSGPAISRD